MGFLSFILAITTIKIDRHFDPSIPELNFVFAHTAGSARTILATIAGAMIGVAATSFSITMVAVTSAAGQFGPRLIGNFMRDRGNQLVLGTFTSTFIYALSVLRTVRDEQVVSGQDIAEFVPNISLLTAIGLTFLSIAVLIYFIHHVPEALNVGNITARVGRDLRDEIRTMSEPKFAARRRELEMEKLRSDLVHPICSLAEGYVQTVQVNKLIEIAASLDTVFELIGLPGKFVTSGDTIVTVHGSEDISDDIIGEIRACFATGRNRTAHQNIMFLADELIEILARALSPGVNDPFTAINCVHWYQSAFNAFLEVKPVPPVIIDEQDKPRLIFPLVNFDQFVNTVCDRSRPYICTDDNVLNVMCDCLNHLVRKTDSDEFTQILETQVKKFK